MEQDSLDLRVFLRLFRKWWWVLAIGLLGASLPAYYATGSSTPVYESTVKVFVQGRASPGIPSAGDLQTSRELADDYEDLILTRRVLRSVIDDLGLPYGTEALASKLAISSPRSLIEIRARDTVPSAAADIANGVAGAFIDDFRDRNLSQIALFQSSLNQIGIQQDPSTVSAQAALISTFSVIEDAVASRTPLTPPVGRNTTLAGALGLLLAIMAIYLLEHLDDSVKSPQQIRDLTGLIALGTIPRVKHKDKDLRVPLVQAENASELGVGEAYQYLQTNLEFAAIGKTPLRRILVTSPGPSEGKTTTAANLALSMARGGRRVILVDLDLRRPQIHQLFNLGGHPGLTNVLLGKVGLDDAIVSQGSGGLRVLTSGPIPPDPARILQSVVMRSLADQLSQQADVVIYDSPPVLAVADPLLVAPLVDGVLIVVSAGDTSVEALKRSVQSLQQANPDLLGVVLNKISEKGSHEYYYYNYHHYAEYGHRPEEKRRTLKGAQKRNGRSKPAKLLENAAQEPRHEGTERDRPESRTPDEGAGRPG